jgi:hypothetical protein
MREHLLLLIFWGPHTKTKERGGKEKIQKKIKKYWMKIKKYINKKNMAEHLGNCRRLVRED